jgi:hypothetical protein
MVSVSTVVTFWISIGIFGFFILCNTIAAYCTSYNEVNVCVGFSLYTRTDTRGIYDIKMYYLLSNIFTGSHNW